MKKISLLVFILVISMITFGQVDSTVVVPDASPVIETATNFIESVFISVGAVAGAILFLFGLINDKLLKKPMNDTWTQVTTWLLALVLGGVGYYFNLGIFADVGIIWSGVLSIGSGLVANGLFTLEKVQQGLAFLGVIYPKTKNRTNTN